MGHAIDARERRSFCTQPAAKRFDALRRSLDLDGHAAGVVADKASETLLRCKPVDERPKANALHHAAHQRATHASERFRTGLQGFIDNSRLALQSKNSA